MMDSSEKNLWNITGCTEYIETVFFFLNQVLIFSTCLVTILLPLTISHSLYFYSTCLFSEEPIKVRKTSYL